MYLVTGLVQLFASPAPHGAGGLKLNNIGLIRILRLSRPARGGWIEIVSSVADFKAGASRPARGGWIEIGLRRGFAIWSQVPPRTGRVD